jgi:diguanylate cyclase (GGDEF)-like protein/PAS domain S-box-containing protein
VIAFIAVACVALAALGAYQRWRAYDDELAQARSETENLANSLAQHAQDAFSAADTVLIGLQERVTVDGTGPAALERLSRVMRLRVATMPQIRGLFLFDAEGRWLANSVPGTRADLNYSDRDYFRYHRDHTDPEPLVGDPIQSKVDGSWIMTITRRLNHPDGSFAGVIDATLSVDLFNNHYAKFDVGQKGVITLISNSGKLWIRHPREPGVYARNVAKGQMFSMVQPDVPARSFEYLSLIDGRTRLGTYHRVAGFPMMVLVAQDKAEVLQNWWRETLISSALVVVIALIIGALGYRLSRQIADQERIEALYRLLADNSSDAIVCTGLDGQRRYVSPSFCTMLGWSADDLVGTSWTMIVPEEDRPILLKAMEDLRSGVPEVAGIYRYLRGDGTTIWVEMRARATVPRPGGAVEMVANIRDITRQKAAEDELARVNAELEILTLTDALTGVGNRRQFDQVIRKEWNRAMRDGKPVALLLVDADCFKSYNDRYGHQMGDECLKAIAQVLSTSIRRPADLAARYGGEEFVVILPNTPGQAAADLAQIMRRKLQELEILHEGNPNGVATISIGVAVEVPERGSVPDGLIVRADQALYHAKNGGRNRVVLAGPTEVAKIAG